MSNEGGRIRIGGLWDHQGDKGGMGGNFGQLRIDIWPNGYKNKATDPDWIVYIKQADKREGGQDRPAERRPEQVQPDTLGDDDIPF